MDFNVQIVFKKGKIPAIWRDYDQFITEERVPEEMREDLSYVIVEMEDDRRFVLRAPIYIEVESDDGKCHFIFDTLPEDERQIRELRSDIEYIAMMADIEL